MAEFAVLKSRCAVAVEEEEATMLEVKRLDQVVRSTEEALTRAAKSLPRWVQWVILAASIVLLITQFWPH